MTKHLNQGLMFRNASDATRLQPSIQTWTSPNTLQHLDTIGSPFTDILRRLRDHNSSNGQSFTTLSTTPTKIREHQ
jgi:hypothetical protein